MSGEDEQKIIEWFRTVYPSTEVHTGNYYSVELSVSTFDQALMKMLAA